VFRLAREGIVHGRVLDGAGRPAVDVEVTLYQYRPATFAHLAGRRPEYTDDRGEFRFFGLNPGQYVVGYAPREFAIREPPPFEFGGSGYRPTVRGEFAPLRSVPATLYPGARRLEDAGIIDLAIGEELELRDVTLAAPSLGRIELELDGGETPPQDLRISALGVEADGAGVLSTEPLTFWPRQVGMVHIMANWTRDDGETVSLSTPVLFDGGDTDVRIDLSPQGSLDIRTVRENADGTVEAVSGRVRLCPARFDPWLCVDSGLLFGGMARSDRIVLDDGLARVSSLPAGEYHLFGVDVPEGSYLASALQGERDVLVDGVDVSGNSAPLDLRFATGSASLAGRVTDANGEPVPQAFVVLIPEAPLRYSWVADHRAWTAVDGTFALEGIAPGRYRIAARPYPRGSVHVPDAEAIREIRERGTPVEFGVGDEGSVDLVLDGASLN
jgi:protocatechuate 3,4-dioxygenase beta subunit